MEISNINTKILDDIELYKAARDYWTKQLEGSEIQEEFFPHNNNNEKPLQVQKQEYMFVLEADLILKLQKITGNQPIVFYSYCVCALQLLIHRLSGRNKVYLSSPVYHSTKELEGINDYIVLENEFHKNMTIRECLNQTHHSVVQGYLHQHYPWEELLKDENRGISYFIHRIILEYDAIHQSGDEQSDFHLRMNTSEGDMVCTLHYNETVYSKDMIQRICYKWRSLIQQMGSWMKCPIQDVEIITPEERSLLNTINQTKKYFMNKTVIELFEEEVVKHPELIALIDGSKTISYKTLNHRANQIARFLLGKGIKRDDVVGIMMPRCIEFIVGILGVLKAGAAYVPIDIEYPLNRKKHILSNCKVPILLCSEGMKEGNVYDCKCYELNDELGRFEAQKNLDYHPCSEDLAYIIYTSGSTGKPKGVMIEHGSLSNYIIWARDKFLPGNGLKMPLYSQITFDLTVTSIYTPLISGNSIVIYGSDVENCIEKIVKENLVDVVKLTPSHLRIMQEIKIPEYTRIQCLIVGGEKLERSVSECISKQFRDKVRIFNEYGPTEATVGCMIYQYCEEDEKSQVSIGRPISNMQIYVLDQYQKECSINTVGEMYIGGVGLARGYRENEILTKEKFLSDIPDIDKRVYRTGDLARWCDDGNLEYIGRLDDQVKINGYRIELDEIKEKLQNHPEVKEAVVIDRKNSFNGKHYLCAYIILREVVASEELKEYLRSELPEYMVPGHYVFMERFPLTTNGKLDKKLLPEPEKLNELHKNCQEPRNPLEHELVELWARVLGIKKMGIFDSFLDMGGDSIAALKLQALIQRRYQIEIPIRHFYNEYTVFNMEEYINSSKKKRSSDIRKAVKQEQYEASNSQKRLYTLQKTGQVGTSYNIPMFFEIRGDFDAKRIEDVIRTIIERHEILRTSFYLNDSKLVQRIEENPNFDLLQSQNQNNKLKPEDWIEEFDLKTAPLIRAKLIHTDSQTYFMLDMHHIISDGVTMELFLQEFEDLYNRKQLPPVKFQYKDFSEWQNKIYAKSEKRKLHEEYWKKQFKEEVRPLNVATDHKRAKRKSYSGDNLEFRIDASITKQIRDFARNHGCTVFMVLLSAYEIMLSRYSGETDITVGSPVLGRPYTEFQQIMGMFINTVVLRNKVEGKKKYVDFLQEVKDTAVDAYEHQDYQFDDLVEVLQLKTDLNRNPLFDVMFVMQNPSIKPKEKAGLELKLHSANHSVAKLDLTLTAYEQQEEYHFNFEYNTDLYEHDTIMKFAESLQKILHSILKDSTQTLASIDMITEEDSKLLKKINKTECQVPNITLVELFEEQVKKTPKAIAVSHNDSALTFIELNCRANQLAWKLKEHGVITDDIIGIMLERSIDFLTGVLAIMKTGAAYVPIEVDYPPERKSFILKDSGAKLLISKSKYMEQVVFNGKCLEPIIEVEQAKIDNLELQCSPDSLAYLIYTSGSTGKPKGVMIRQKNLVNYILWAKKIYIHDKKGDMPLYSRLGFDLTVTSIYLPLISGNRVVVYGDEYGQFALKKVIEENKVDIIKLTPAHLHIITEWAIPIDCRIHTFIVGGESLASSLADQISKSFGNDVTIYNEYGPTEATVGCMIYQYRPDDLDIAVSIGRPADNVQIYVLGDELSTMPINVPGEIYIGGDSVAKGYMNNPDMTQAHFIADPFKPGSIIYKTGDIGKWRKDGNLEFLGRKDFQIKIRGYRVELEEIQKNLLSLNQIKEAVVIDRVDKVNSRYLCAYIVKAFDISEEAIRNELKKTLPDYMIPSVYVFLKELPINSNGKIDRGQLPEPVYKNRNTYSPPANRIERALLSIWKRLLNRDNVGVEDDFFELGGDSIKAVQVEVEAEKLGLYHGDMLSIQIYETPTIRSLASFIKDTDKQLKNNIILKEK